MGDSADQPLGGLGGGSGAQETTGSLLEDELFMGGAEGGS